MVKDWKDKKKSQWSVKYIDKDEPEAKPKALIKDISYEAGSISRNAVNGLKKLTETDTYKYIGKGIGVFQGDIGTGWRKPERVIVKDAIKIKGNPFGVIVGSFARCTAEELKRSYKATASYLSKVYKKGRITLLVKTWKAEHLGATKAEEEMAVKKIEQLFKTREGFDGRE